LHVFKLIQNIAKASRQKREAFYLYKKNNTKNLNQMKQISQQQSKSLNVKFIKNAKAMVMGMCMIEMC
jgi:ribosomal protein L11